MTIQFYILHLIKVNWIVSDANSRLVILNSSSNHFNCSESAMDTGSSLIPRDFVYPF